MAALDRMPFPALVCECRPWPPMYHIPLIPSNRLKATYIQPCDGCRGLDRYGLEVKEGGLLRGGVDCS
jgi:hypothetical protein